MREPEKRDDQYTLPKPKTNRPPSWKKRGIPLSSRINSRNPNESYYYNNGYEQALIDILEMIEADFSFEELYESIGEYLS